MSYIFISHYLHEELDSPTYEEEDSYKKSFTRSIRAVISDPDEDGWVKTRGYISSFPEWWIDPIEYPELKVVYIYE